MELGFRGKGRCESQPGRREGSRTLGMMIWKVGVEVLASVAGVEDNDEV